MIDSHSCYVWCRKKGGGYLTQGWKVPDGTPCGKEDPRIGQTRYCVNGECRLFDCNGYSGENSSSVQCPHALGKTIKFNYSLANDLL